MGMTGTAGSIGNNAHVYPRARTAWAGVAILFVIYASSFVDRQLISLLVEPIRADLQISDTQISLLHGFAFALFYALLGGPIGRLVDRGDRRHVLFAGVAAWSLFTCACGAARSFSGLFAARLGVGVGEATVAPTTYSLLADYFPPDRRGLPMAVFGAGVYVGMGLALLLGGALISALSAHGPFDMPLIGALKPWQTAFILAGAPGLLLCFSVYLLWDPRSQRGGKPLGPTMSILPHWRAHWRAIAGHHGAIALMAVALYALLAWAPEYFRRIHHVAPGHIGLWIGMIVMLCGTTGVIAAGLSADWLAARDMRHARLTVAMIAALAACPALLCVALAPTSVQALMWLGVAIFCLASLTTCGPTGVQELNPAALRGSGAALFQFIVTLVGLGIGPTMVPMVSDYLLRDESRLDLALAWTLPAVALLSAILSFLSRKSYAMSATIMLREEQPVLPVIARESLVQSPA